MSTLTRTIPTPKALSTASELTDKTKAFARAATSENTRRAYARQWAAFEAWCATYTLTALPAEPSSVAVYASAMADAGRRVSTIEQAIAAISAAHGAAGVPSPRSDPQLRLVLKGIRRTIGTAQREAAPLLGEHLRAVVDALPDSTLGARDRAMLLLGFAGAFRRSELVGLTVADVAFTPDGIEINLRRSKTDQEARGRIAAIPFSSSRKVCPVRALQAWLVKANITEGPLFREVDRHGRVQKNPLTGRSVARIVKRGAVAAGLDGASYSGHSLRAGFVSAAKIRGKNEAAIMRQTGHKSLAMLRKYDRRAELWRDDHAGLGLLD